MEKTTKALLALALVISAFLAITEGGRDVPGKEEADTDSPLHTMTFGSLLPWAWWPWGGGLGKGAGGTSGGWAGPWGGLGAFLSWLAGHPWFAGHPWLGRFAGYGGGGAPDPWKTSDLEDAKKGDSGLGNKYP